MKILYFTATGNDLYIAKEFGGEYYSIPKMMKEGRFDFEDEKIGIVFPTYYGGVPKIVEEFINKLSLKSKYIFGVASYGAFSGAVVRHLTDIGKRNGIEFSYINVILMVDNYLPGFNMDKQIQGEAKKNIDKNLVNIIKDIEEGRKYIKKSPSIMKLFQQLAEKKYNSQFDKNFSVGTKCNQCKVCEKVCPVDNIKVDKQPVFKNNCQQCLACIHNCPQSTISLKNEKSKARFINQNVTLNEIIKANN